MNTNNLLYYLAAIRLPTIGPIIVRRWLQSHEDIASLFSASQQELADFGFKSIQIANLKKINWRAIERDAEWCEKNSCKIISLQDLSYPKLLQEIPDAPLLLFVKGDTSLLSRPQLAIVGSRNPTQMGITNAFEFADCLSQTGLVITSGLALGIDAASHSGTLRCGGKTIAVLGTGLNMIYPSKQRQLAEEIMENGAWVTEFPPFELPKAKNFPRRNRIISGLSIGVLVIEAAVRSGSLITARLAAEQGREVFAVPGSIHNPVARGCHQLIRQGAKLVEKATDIIEELSPLATTFLPCHDILSSSNSTGLDADTQKILNYVGYEVTPVDAIMLYSGLTMGEVSSMLLALELQGLIQHVVGGYVRMSGH